MIFRFKLWITVSVFSFEIMFSNSGNQCLVFPAFGKWPRSFNGVFAMDTFRFSNMLCLWYLEDAVHRSVAGYLPQVFRCFYSFVLRSQMIEGTSFWTTGSICWWAWSQVKLIISVVIRRIRMTSASPQNIQVRLATRKQLEREEIVLEGRRLRITRLA